MVPSATVSFGAEFVTKRPMGTERSPEPETFKYTVLLYVPGAKLSATLVLENRMVLGTEPVRESTVNQIGKDVVSTEKNAPGTEPEETVTSTFPAVPEPFV